MHIASHSYPLADVARLTSDQGLVANVIELPRWHTKVSTWCTNLKERSVAVSLNNHKLIYLKQYLLSTLLSATILDSWFNAMNQIYITLSGWKTTIHKQQHNPHRRIIYGKLVQIISLDGGAQALFLFAGILKIMFWYVLYREVEW